MIAQHGGELREGTPVLTLPIYLRRRQGAMLIQSQAPSSSSPHLDRALIRALALAQIWARSLENGDVGSIKDLAKREGLCAHYTARLLPLAYLAPDITQAILAGLQPRVLTLKALTAQPLPIGWDEQRRMISTLSC